jgi:hypothetical protein
MVSRYNKFGKGRQHQDREQVRQCTGHRFHVWEAQRHYLA